MTIRKPVFHLARNLAVVHNLMDNKAYLPGKTADETLAGCTLTASLPWLGDAALKQLPLCGAPPKTGFFWAMQ